MIKLPETPMEKRYWVLRVMEIRFGGKMLTPEMRQELQTLKLEMKRLQQDRQQDRKDD